MKNNELVPYTKEQAKNLTPEGKATLLHNLTLALQREVRRTNERVFIIADVLDFILKTKLYEFCDSSMRYTFPQWLAQSEISIGVSTAREWIRMKREFVDKAKIDTEVLAKITYRNLRVLLGVKDKTPEVLEAAANNTATDFILFLTQGKIPIGGCTHPNFVEVTSWKCQVCGEWFKNKPGSKPQREELSSMIDELIVEFMNKTELEMLGESNKVTRRYAQLILQRYDRQEVSECLDWLLQDDFWKEKLTKMSQLYRNMPAYKRGGQVIQEKL
jgi:hypothetical protein